MNSVEKQLKNLHDLSLSSEIKSRMREELSAYADLHTLPAVSKAKKTAILNPFSFIGSHRIYTSFALVVLILAGMGGTAFAAQGTLPGNILYPVKVAITEPLQTALIPSPRGKATWHAILAERRLEEASELAASNSLSSADQQELATDFTAQVNSSERNANRLQRMGDTVGALDVRSDLEARITAHEQILSTMAVHLAVIDQEASTTTGTQSVALATLLTTVHTQQNAIESARVALEGQINPSATSTLATTAGTAPSGGHGMPIHFKAPHYHSLTPEQHVALADTARTEEVHAILQKNAAILAKFAVPASTTQATTTATTTTAITTASSTSAEATTSSEENIKQ